MQAGNRTTPFFFFLGVSSVAGERQPSIWRLWDTHWKLSEASAGGAVGVFLNPRSLQRASGSYRKSVYGLGSSPRTLGAPDRENFVQEA